MEGNIRYSSVSSYATNNRTVLCLDSHKPVLFEAGEGQVRAMAIVPSKFTRTKDVNFEVLRFVIFLW